MAEANDVEFGYEDMVVNKKIGAGKAINDLAVLPARVIWAKLPALSLAAAASSKRRTKTWHFYFVCFSIQFYFWLFFSSAQRQLTFAFHPVSAVDYPTGECARENRPIYVMLCPNQGNHELFVVKLSSELPPLQLRPRAQQIVALVG